MDHNQNDNGWDKWNSNASNNSYYNQPTHSPYKGRGFEYASLICGLISVTAVCTGLLSLPLGALSILFAILTYRAGKKMSSVSKMGIWLSCFGIGFSIITVIFTFATLPSRLKDETFRGQLDAIYEQTFGMDFDEFMEEYYGVTFDQ